MTYAFDSTVWLLGKELPPEALPQPAVAVTLDYLKLETLIEDHVISAANAADQHDHNAELFHVARESYLRQRLAAVVLYRLTPDRKGNA